MKNNLFVNIRGIIFDMDGLMINSEPYHWLAFDKIFREFNKELPETENAKNYIGISDIDTAKDMVQRYNLPISPEYLVLKKQTYFKDFLEQIVPQPGLMELLPALHNAGFKKAIASGATLIEIKTIVEILDVQNYFDIFCSAEEVSYGKPAPDIFLLAARRLNLLPSECVVLEDAPSGIEAANAAGMLSIAIAGRETAHEDFSTATLKLPSLSDVFEHLNKSD